MFLRHHYLQKLLPLLGNSTQKVVFLTGSRGSGKTTLLKQIEQQAVQTKKNAFRYGFDQELLVKRFQSLEDFRGFIHLKLGISLYEPHILFLNEIQYAEGLLDALYNYTQATEFKTQIFATSTSVLEVPLHSGYVVQEIHPFSFEEFLSYHHYPIARLPLNEHTPALFSELEKYIDVYLKRGGYPQVVMQQTAESKQENLTTVMEKILSKDAGLLFNRHHLYGLERFLAVMPEYNQQLLKHARLSQESKESIYFIKQYLSFLLDQHLVVLRGVQDDKPKTQEKHQIISFCDTGILHVLQNYFGNTLHDRSTIFSFVREEIRRTIGEDRYTYRKQNGSQIDILGSVSQQKVAIFVDTTNSLSLPKILLNPHLDQHRDIAIKTTTSKYAQKRIGNKTITFLPHYLVAPRLKTMLT